MFVGGEVGKAVDMQVHGTGLGLVVGCRRQGTRNVSVMK